MKKFFLLFAFVIAAFGSLSAQEQDYIQLGDVSKISVSGYRSSGNDAPSDPTLGLPRTARIHKAVRAEMKYKDVTVNDPGTLESVLGDEINDIDSLVVRGNINADDIHTMWSGSLYGRLTVINLEFAGIKDNKLPENAFWYQSEQYTPGSEYINCIRLRRIILPETLTDLGEYSFMYAIKLEEINLPASLHKIPARCFSDCISLNVDPLVIPEGIEEIGHAAFANCRSLKGEVRIPATLKRIDDYAFYQSKISACNFPEGLEEINTAAFYACRLKKVTLPDTCQSLPGNFHFSLNYELESINLPEGLTVIPNNFMDDCISLRECAMPNSVERIGDGAFWQCGALKELHLSSNLKYIGPEGLYYCKGLKSISFPSNLETMEAKSCVYWKNIESIYCAAVIPPTCVNSKVNPGWSPFGNYGSDFENRTPQDTPIYVPRGSADLYRNAWGWDYFTNFIEIDEFPEAGIHDAIIDNAAKSHAIYDLNGLPVSQPKAGEIYISDGHKFVFK